MEDQNENLDTPWHIFTLKPPKDNEWLAGRKNTKPIVLSEAESNEIWDLLKKLLEESS